MLVGVLSYASPLENVVAFTGEVPSLNLNHRLLFVIFLQYHPHISVSESTVCYAG